MNVTESRYVWYCERKIGVMRVELQMSREIAIWDDSDKYAGEVWVRVGRLSNIFKGVAVRKPSRTSFRVLFQAGASLLHSPFLNALLDLRHNNIN